MDRCICTHAHTRTHTNRTLCSPLSDHYSHNLITHEHTNTNTHEYTNTNTETYEYTHKHTRTYEHEHRNTRIHNRTPSRCLNFLTSIELKNYWEEVSIGLVGGVCVHVCVCVCMWFYFLYYIFYLFVHGLCLYGVCCI